MSGDRSTRRYQIGHQHETGAWLSAWCYRPSLTFAYLDAIPLLSTRFGSRSWHGHRQISLSFGNTDQLRSLVLVRRSGRIARNGGVVCAPGFPAQLQSPPDGTLERRRLRGIRLGAAARGSARVARLLPPTQRGAEGRDQRGRKPELLHSMPSCAKRVPLFEARSLTALARLSL